MNRVLGGSGRSIPANVREDLERSFDADLSEVRVHTAAPEAAESLGAAAFTHGSDIVFGEGRFEPDTATGKRLLAHELAHVLQQRAGGDASPAAAEADAGNAATRAAAGAPARVGVGTAPRVARRDRDEEDGNNHTRNEKLRQAQRRSRRDQKESGRTVVEGLDDSATATTRAIVMQTRRERDADLKRGRQRGSFTQEERERIERSFDTENDVVRMDRKAVGTERKAKAEADDGSPVPSKLEREAESKRRRALSLEQSQQKGKVSEEVRAPNKPGVRRQVGFFLGKELTPAETTAKIAEGKRAKEEGKPFPGLRVVDELSHEHTEDGVRKVMTERKNNALDRFDVKGQNRAVGDVIKQLNRAEKHEPAESDEKVKSVQRVKFTRRPAHGPSGMKLDPAGLGEREDELAVRIFSEAKRTDEVWFGDRRITRDDLKDQITAAAPATAARLKANNAKQKTRKANSAAKQKAMAAGGAVTPPTAKKAPPKKNRATKAVQKAKAKKTPKPKKAPTVTKGTKTKPLKPAAAMSQKSPAKAVPAKKAQSKTAQSKKAQSGAKTQGTRPVGTKTAPPAAAAPPVAHADHPAAATSSAPRAATPGTPATTPVATTAATPSTTATPKAAPTTHEMASKPGAPAPAKAPPQAAPHGTPAFATPAGPLPAVPSPSAATPPAGAHNAEPAGPAQRPAASPPAKTTEAAEQPLSQKPAPKAPPKGKAPAPKATTGQKVQAAAGVASSALRVVDAAKKYDQLREQGMSASDAAAQIVIDQSPIGTYERAVESGQDTAEALITTASTELAGKLKLPVAGGPTAAMIGVANQAAHALGAPQGVTDATTLAAEATSMPSQVLVAGARSYYNIGKAIGGDTKGLDKMNEDMKSGGLGTPLQGYAMMAEGITDIASGEDAEMVLERLAKAGKGSTADRVGSWLGDKMYDAYERATGESDEDWKKQVEEINRKTAARIAERKAAAEQHELEGAGAQ